MDDTKQIYTDTLAALTDLGVAARDARELMDGLIEAHTAPLKQQVGQMQSDCALLDRLHLAGVDNWEGYSIACQGEDDDVDDEFYEEEQGL